MGRIIFIRSSVFNAVSTIIGRSICQTNYASFVIMLKNKIRKVDTHGINHNSRKRSTLHCTASF